MSKWVGKYQLTERIGKGSFADVYLGVHSVSKEKYAVKAIAKESLTEPKLLAGLESEIRIMKDFDHINIIRLHEYFGSEKNFYLVLELCEGGDLSKFIKKNKRLDEPIAHSFLKQLTIGLTFLHGKSFIHRDLKPANVLLTQANNHAILKLADFGFAKHLASASLAQTRCGTPLYMAPEILDGREYDGKADVWSVGCILYEMLVGSAPFKGMNERDLLQNIKTKELSIPKDLLISRQSIEVLAKLLERNPTRRASLDQLAPIANRLSAECTSTVDSNLNVPAPDPTSDCDSHERRMKSCDRSLNSDARLGLCTKSNELQTRKDVLLDNLKSGRESEHYNELSPGRDNSDQTSDRKMDVKSREVPMMTTRSKKAVTVDSKAQTRDQKKTTINSSSSTSISMNLGKAIAYVLNPSVNSYVASQDSRDLNIERQVVRDTNSEIGTHQKSQKSHSSRVLATGSSRVENTTIHKASDVWSDDEFVIIDSCNDTKNRELNIPETVTKNNEVDQFKESNSVQAVLGSMVKRSEVYMKAIKVFILLADKTFENALISSKVVGNGMMNINPNVSKKLVDQCLAALSLYFHSLEIMKSLVKSFETFVKSDLRSLNTPVEKFREELVFSSKTIMDRTEGVYIVIREIVEKTHNDHFRTAHSIPIPELVVYNSINKIASDATIEELMGNFRSACESYDFSLSLMDSLSITAFHVEDQRKLHMEHRVLQDKYQRCKSKEEAMWEY